MRRFSRYKPRSIRRFERNTKKRLIFTLIFIFIFLFVFINWGLPFLIDSLSFLNKFKPNKTETVQLEDAAIAPPVFNIPFEATNSAAIKISGYSTPNSKVEIYFDEQLQETVNTDGSGQFATGNLELSLGTNNIYGKTINDSGKKSLPSKNIKLIYNNEKPNLEVSEPEDGKEIKGGDKKVRISGKTDKDNSVTVNGSTVIVSSEGAFTTEIGINEGDNIITISATNNFGNSSKIERKVKYSP